MRGCRYLLSLPWFAYTGRCLFSQHYMKVLVVWLTLSLPSFAYTGRHLFSQNNMKVLVVWLTLSLPSFAYTGRHLLSQHYVKVLVWLTLSLSWFAYTGKIVRWCPWGLVTCSLRKTNKQDTLTLWFCVHGLEWICHWSQNENFLWKLEKVC